MDINRRIGSRAAKQHGLITRLQLEAIRAPRGLVRGMLVRGALEPVGRQTFRLAGAPATDHQRVLAACLDTGGVAACRTAAWLHGIEGFTVGPRPEVMVDRRQFDYRWPLARVHTTTWLPMTDIVDIQAVPTLGVARMLFSLASLVPNELTHDQVRGAVDHAAQEGLARDPWLWWTLERLRCRGRNGVAVFEQILGTRAGGAVTESWLERETLEAIRASGMPAPVCQRRVRRNGSFVARVDFAYPSVMLIIEVSGYRWHRTRQQMAADLKRRRALTLAGHRVLEYTYDDVVARPDQMLAEIAEALGVPLAA